MWQICKNVKTKKVINFVSQLKSFRRLIGEDCVRKFDIRGSGHVSACFDHQKGWGQAARLGSGDDPPCVIHGHSGRAPACGQRCLHAPIRAIHGQLRGPVDQINVLFFARPTFIGEWRNQRVLQRPCTAGILFALLSTLTTCLHFFTPKGIAS